MQVAERVDRQVGAEVRVADVLIDQLHLPPIRLASAVPQVAIVGDVKDVRGVLVVENEPGAVGVTVDDDLGLPAGAGGGGAKGERGNRDEE